MKSFKIADLVTQLLFISIGFIYAISRLKRPDLNPFVPYFIVGGWQIVSYLVHYFFFTPTIFQHNRKVYGRIVLFLLLFGIVLLTPAMFGISGIEAFAILFLSAILIISPFLAIFYLLICWKEYRLMTQRELIHLK